MLRHMRTGELEHVNSETKHLSTQQKTRPQWCAVTAEVALIRGEVRQRHLSTAASTRGPFFLHVFDWLTSFSREYRSSIAFISGENVLPQGAAKPRSELQLSHFRVDTKQEQHSLSLIF